MKKRGIHFIFMALLALTTLLACDGRAPESGRQEAEQTVSSPPVQTPATAASSGAEGAPVHGGRMVWALLAEPGNLLWPFSSDNASHLAGQYFLDTALLKYDKDLNIVPLAAERYEVLDDGRRLVFHLRHDVTWEDGRELTAADVEFTYNLMREPDTPTAYADDFLAVESLTVLDPWTIEVRYAEPYIRSLITWMHGVLPKHRLEGLHGRELLASPLGRQPLSAGPYRLTERGIDGRLVLQARDDWFKGRPMLDQIVIQPVPDQATQMLELQAERLDRVNLTPRQYLFQFKGQELEQRCGVYPYLDFSYTYIGWNLRHPLFSDRRVRVALAHGVNKQEIVQGVLLGQGQPTIGPYKPGTWVYNTEIVDYPYDPAKAKDLLAEAGWTDTNGDGVLDKDGRAFEFTLLTNQGNDLRIKTATILQQRFQALGVRMQIRTVEWAAFIQEFVHPGRFDAVILGWTITQDPDAYSVWHSSKTKPGELNFIGYQSAEADALLEKGRRTLDQAKSKPIYDELQRVLHRDQPYCFLYVPNALPAVHTRFHGVTPAPSGIDHNLPQWWVPRDLQRFRLEP